MTIDRSRGIVRADEHGLPIHGALAAAEDWDVVDAGADDGAAWLTATLDYGRRDDRLAVFPFRHQLELGLRLEGDALTVTTTVEPTGGNEVPLAFGWHPWLALPGVARADWELDLPERTMVELDDRKLPTGERAAATAERAPLADRVLDVHCAVAEDARFALAGGGARDRGRVGGRLPLRPGVRAGRPRRRLPGADDGSRGRALHRRGPRARATGAARERDVPRARHVVAPSRPAGRG